MSLHFLSDSLIHTRFVLSARLASQSFLSRPLYGVGDTAAMPVMAAHCTEQAAMAALHVVAADIVNGAASHAYHPAEAVVTVPATMPAAE